jgi:hypothetical protein
VTAKCKIKAEFNKIACVGNLDTKLFSEFSLQSLIGIFPSIDRTSEKTLVTGIENAGFLTAQLHQISLIVDNNQPDNRIRGHKIAVTSEKRILHFVANPIAGVSVRRTPQKLCQ